MGSGRRLLRGVLIFSAIAALVSGACFGAAKSSETDSTSSPLGEPSETTPRATPSPTPRPREFLSLTPDEEAGTITPEQTRFQAGYFVQVLPRDAIRPIYEPQFVSADQAGLLNKELVIGVSHNGVSKAYPIGLLVRREMVNDTIADLPILVTW